MRRIENYLLVYLQFFICQIFLFIVSLHQTNHIIQGIPNNRKFFFIHRMKKTPILGVYVIYLVHNLRGEKNFSGIFWEILHSEPHYI
jgi:hypothetical protein